MTATTAGSQPLVALAKANQHRLAQAAFKRSLEAMPATDAQERFALTLEAEVVAPEIAATHIFQLLRACPKVGEVKARTALRVVGVPEYKRLRDLTPRQRLALAVQVRRIHRDVV